MPFADPDGTAEASAQSLEGASLRVVVELQACEGEERCMTFAHFTYALFPK